MKKLPNFIIVGSQKAGTTTLARNLAKVPEVFMANNNSIEGEPHFFDYKWERGIDWYQSLFETDKGIIGEKTPNYLSYYDAHSRMHSVVPQAKLIILLRNPIDRAYSAWNHFNQIPQKSSLWGWEISDFETAIFERDNEVHQRLLFNGRYIDHIRHLLNYYSRNQMHFVISERLRANPHQEFEKVLNFIGANPYEIDFENTHERSYESPMLDETRNKLSNFFEKYNQRLSDFLEEDIPEWGVKKSSTTTTRKKYSSIIMLSSGRSGTHALRSLLGQFDHLKIYGEILNQDLQRKVEGDFTRFFERLIRLQPDWTFSGKFADEIIVEYFKYIKNLSNGLIPLIDIKEEQLGILNWSVHEINEMPRMLEHIQKLNVPIIRVTRRNRLAQYCSLMIATKTGKWSLGKNDLISDSEKAILIEREHLFRKLYNYEKTEEMIDEWLVGNPQVTKLYYEDCFIDEKPSSYLKNEIKKSLGLHLKETQLPTTTKIVRDYRQYIINLDEVTNWLKGSNFEKYLDMPS